MWLSSSQHNRFITQNLYMSCIYRPDISDVWYDLSAACYTLLSAMMSDISSLQCIWYDVDSTHMYTWHFLRHKNQGLESWWCGKLGSIRVKHDRQVHLFHTHGDISETILNLLMGVNWPTMFCVFPLRYVISLLVVCIACIAIRIN